MKPGMQKISGYTYPVRDRLKELGAKWDADDKAWYIEEEKLEEANAIVGKKESKPRKAFHTKCPVCGTEFDANQQRTN